MWNNMFYDLEDGIYRTYPDGDEATGRVIRREIESKDTKIRKLEKEKQELIEYLKERETELKENVRTYEEKLRRTSRENFYYNSYLKTLHRYRAERELIKEILSKIEKR